MIVFIYFLIVVNADIFLFQSKVAELVEAMHTIPISEEGKYYLFSVYVFCVNAPIPLLFCFFGLRSFPPFRLSSSSFSLYSSFFYLLFNRCRFLQMCYTLTQGLIRWKPGNFPKKKIKTYEGDTWPFC